MSTVLARTACVGESEDPAMRDVALTTSDALLAWARPHYHNDEAVARALAEAGLV